MREIKPYCTEGKDFRFHSYLKNCVCICWINKYWLIVCVCVCVYTLCICAYVCVCVCTYTHSISEYPCYSLIRNFSVFFWDFPCSSVSKESACNARNLGLIPGLGRSHGEGNGNPLQYSCLENPMDREAWWATVHGATRVGHDLTTKPPPAFSF